MKDPIAVSAVRVQPREKVDFLDSVEGSTKHKCYSLSIWAKQGQGFRVNKITVCQDSDTS
ncbi:unnamed protein product [Coffea canephora]|uniref:Uncharacterized protein n=1 Tax=Coffea canephora TaxID=49390 RepID=A0A068V7N6_COFCA|nr:unnamed protein product [Coffea canephora]